MEIPSPRTNKRARIEIIPLIDIIFFLLATFVMVSLSMVKNSGIGVNLPVAATSAPQDRSESTSITVTENGEVFWNKEPIAMGQLPSRLAALKTSTPDPKVFLNGDTKAQFGAAIEVLDEVRKAGIVKVAIETKPK